MHDIESAQAQIFLEVLPDLPIKGEVAGTMIAVVWPSPNRTKLPILQRGSSMYSVSI